MRVGAGRARLRSDERNRRGAAHRHTDGGRQSRRDDAEPDRGRPRGGLGRGCAPREGRPAAAGRPRPPARHLRLAGPLHRRRHRPRGHAELTTAPAPGRSTVSRRSWCTGVPRRRQLRALPPGLLVQGRQDARRRTSRGREGRAGARHDPRPLRVPARPGTLLRAGRPVPNWSTAARDEDRRGARRPGASRRAGRRGHGPRRRAMWEAGADGIDFDTAGAAGDGDLLAALLAVERLRAATPTWGSWSAWPASVSSACTAGSSTRARAWQASGRRASGRWSRRPAPRSSGRPSTSTRAAAWPGTSRGRSPIMKPCMESRGSPCTSTPAWASAACRCIPSRRSTRSRALEGLRRDPAPGRFVGGHGDTFGMPVAHAVASGWVGCAPLETWWRACRWRRACDLSEAKDVRCRTAGRERA